MGLATLHQRFRVKRKGVLIRGYRRDPQGGDVIRSSGSGEIRLRLTNRARVVIPTTCPNHGTQLAPARRAMSTSELLRTCPAQLRERCLFHLEPQGWTSRAGFTRPRQHC